jgi:hypothetical protein
VIFLLRDPHGSGAAPGFGVPFCGVYLGMVPLFGLRLLQYSQQWQASDVFRVAPLAGPAALCDGARRAVICLLTVPMFVLTVLIVWIMRGSFGDLVLFIPGVIALPIFSLVPTLGGKGVPLSQPTDAAKAAGRGFNMILVTAVALALSAVTAYAWSHGRFWQLVLVEIVVVGTIYAVMRAFLRKTGWPAEAMD